MSLERFSLANRHVFGDRSWLRHPGRAMALAAVCRPMATFAAYVLCSQLPAAHPGMLAAGQPRRHRSAADTSSHRRLKPDENESSRIDPL